MCFKCVIPYLCFVVAGCLCMEGCCISEGRVCSRLRSPCRSCRSSCIPARSAATGRIGAAQSHSSRRYKLSCSQTLLLCEEIPEIQTCWRNQDFCSSPVFAGYFPQSGSSYQARRICLIRERNSWSDIPYIGVTAERLSPVNSASSFESKTDVRWEVTLLAIICLPG